MPPPQQASQAPKGEVAVNKPKSSLPQKALIGGLALLIALGALLYWIFGTEASTQDIVRIGVPHFPQQNDAIIGFKEGMRKLGYVEGENVEYVMAQFIVGPTALDDMESRIREMIAKGEVDMIFASLEHSAKMAVDISNELGSNMPIVFLTRFHDPVEYGIIESFRSSGNNAAGVASNMLEIIDRTLQFFKEMDPLFEKLGVFTDGYMAPGIGDAYLSELRKRAPL